MQGVAFLGVWGIVTGCRSDAPAGHSLPTTSPQSVALPGAVNSADAPNAPAVAESSTATLVAYRDRAHGLSFEYPSVWRPEQAGGNLPQPEFASVAPKPLITQAFDPARTFYADTVLSSLSFSYTVQSHSDRAACAAIPGRAVQAAGPAQTSTYGGVSFTEAAGSDAGMCHHLSTTVDTALRGSDCFIFERDTATTCPFVKTSKLPRPLTPQEQTALARHLDDVMQSVRIDGLGGSQTQTGRP